MFFLGLRVLGEIYLWSFRVSVEFFHKVHAAFGVDSPVDNGIFQAHPPQMNSYDVEHTGPLGHDHATNITREKIPCGFRL